jgi:Na+/H+ antiporter NhaD/arsenite permease-like protein
MGPIRPTKSSVGPSARTNRRGVLVNASNLLCNIAGLPLSIGDIQPIGHLFTLNFNMFQFINMQICNRYSYHI